MLSVLLIKSVCYNMYFSESLRLAPKQKSSQQKKSIKSQTIHSVLGNERRLWLKGVIAFFI